MVHLHTRAHDAPGAPTCPPPCPRTRRAPRAHEPGAPQKIGMPQKIGDKMACLKFLNRSLGMFDHGALVNCRLRM